MAKKDKMNGTMKVILVVGALLLVFSFAGGDKNSKKTAGVGCTPSTGVNEADKNSIVEVYLTDQACTTEYDPVCLDGITYPNSCSATTAGKTGYTEGECVGSGSVARIPHAIKTSVAKVELYGPDGWIIISDGEIPVEISAVNTQKLVSEKIREGVYTKMRITWGSSIAISFNDGTNKTIDFKTRIWEFDIPQVQAQAGRTTNMLVDVPMKDSLDYQNNQVQFVKTVAFANELEDRFELRKETIGEDIPLNELQTNQAFQRIEDLKERTSCNPIWKTDRRYDSYAFCSVAEAEAKSAAIGCTGYHTHVQDGKTIYMSCSTHTQLDPLVPGTGNY